MGLRVLERPRDKWPSGWERGWRAGADSHQDVEAGSLEKGDLVGDGEGGEAGELLGELDGLDDALGGQFTELVPEVNVQRDALL